MAEIQKYPSNIQLIGKGSMELYYFGTPHPPFAENSAKKFNLIFEPFPYQQLLFFKVRGREFQKSQDFKKVSSVFQKSFNDIQVRLKGI